MDEDDVANMEAAIDRALRASHVAHLAEAPKTPLELLLQKEETDDEYDEWLVRSQSFQKFLMFVFQNGPEPMQVLRNLFSMTKAVKPELLGDMVLSNISIVCADGGKATVSARIKRIYNGKLKAAGITAAAPFQKRGNFAAPQKGNSNRRQGTPIKAKAKRK